MIYTTDNLAFIVPLASEAYRLAEKLGKNQSNSQRARQVYLNILAVYAANFYCQSLGIETDLAGSETFNFSTQVFMDVADLELTHLGKVECRPVLPKERFCHIPPETWDNRLGYLVVEIDESKRQAKLLKFIPPLEKLTRKEEWEIEQLQPLDKFLDHLEQLEEARELNQSVINNLSQWFKDVRNIQAAGWSTVESWLSSPDHGKTGLIAAIRSRETEADLRAFKVIEFDQAEKQAVALFVDIDQSAYLNHDILLQVYPFAETVYLPPGLRLIILDDKGEIFMQAESRDFDNWIQLQFTGEPGEKFSVKLEWRDLIIKEDFII